MRRWPQRKRFLIALGRPFLRRANSGLGYLRRAGKSQDHVQWHLSGQLAKIASEAWDVASFLQQDHMAHLEATLSKSVYS